MAKLNNLGRIPVCLPTGHIVPRLGYLITTNEVLRCADNAAFLNGQVLSGQMEVEYDADPDPAEAPSDLQSGPAEVASLITETPLKSGKKGA